MKEFNLDEYLKDPSKKIVTRNGKNVRIICINAKGNFPIIALVETHNGTETVLRLSEDGHFHNTTKDSRDIFFVTEKQEGWINIYKGKEGHYPGKCLCSTKEEAVNLRCINTEYITTVKVEWEE